MRFFKLFLVVSILCYSGLANAIEVEVRKGQIINLPRPAAHVFIADPTVADIDVRSQNYIYVYGIAVGETTIHALDENNDLILSDSLVVIPNLSNFERNIKNILPDSNVTLDSAGNNIVIKGTVDTPEDAQIAINLANGYLGAGQALVNMLKVRGSDQVMLRVRVAEVARSEIRNFGINLSATLSGAVTYGFVRGSLTPAGNSFTIDDSSGNFTIDGLIDALETEDLVKTLAEPNLTAKSGESATFNAGGEFPIPIPQEDGVTSIEYRDFGVSLSFTPTVLSNDKISLAVAPEVSSLTSSAVTIQNNDIPTLSVRNASTTVELGSGESFAIAGLIQNNVTTDISKFPWLGDIPVIGALFRSSDFQRDETELVIIVTPYIVRGVKDADKLMTPTEGYVPTNDFERLVLGKLYREKHPAGREEGEYEGKIAIRKLHGNPGYILEDNDE